MQIKYAVSVEKDDVIPSPPTSGPPIKPPIFPNELQEEKSVDIFEEEKPSEKKKKEETGYETPISDAVKESLELLKKIVEINNVSIEDAYLEISDNSTTIDDIKTHLTNLIDSISNVKEIAKDIQRMKVPEGVKYESEQEYADSLYIQIISILDDTLSGIEGTFPEYQYNKSSITRFDDGGNILDGEVLVSVVIANYISKVRFHLEIPVYIFDGYIQHPDTFIYAGNRYRFTEDSLNELISYEPDYPRFEEGVHWFDQNKGSDREDAKIPGQKEQKNYKRFDHRLNPVPTKPRFWNSFSSNEDHPNIESIKSSPTVSHQSPYSLY